MQTSNSRRTLAYLISQYPKVSHSFIRREILALERLGWQIFRLSIRGWDLELADPEDISERTKTTFVLKAGAISLGIATVRQAIESPHRFFAATRLATRMISVSNRPGIWHLFYLAEACWVSRKLKERGIAHVHAHFGANDAEVAMLVGELSNITYSFTVHGLEDCGPHLAEKVKRAKFVVAASSFCRSQIFRHSDQQYWQKVSVVYCGIDPLFARIAAVEPSDIKRLVCVGRLCAEKGQLLLMQVAASLVEEGLKFELVLVGDGEHRGAIERLMAERRLSDVVTITGWASASRVRDEILRARALILPSFSEGLPTVIVEAMVLGRPVLSTYIAGIPEVVVNEKTGWLFPASSQEAMMDAIRACLNASQDTLQRMGELARASVLARHDVDYQAQTLSNLFDDVVHSTQINVSKFTDLSGAPMSNALTESVAKDSRGHD